MQLVALNLEPVTGGPFGIGFIPRPFAGLAGDPLLFSLAQSRRARRWSSLVLYLALERLVRSPWGRVLRAIREDEAAARALGKNATRFRLQAFAIGGGIMGLAGAAQAHFIGFIAPDNYHADADLPGLGDADRRRLRQQSRRDPRRGAGLGHLGGFGRRSSRRCSRRTSRRAPRRCRSS